MAADTKRLILVIIAVGAFLSAFLLIHKFIARDLLLGYQQEVREALAKDLRELYINATVAGVLLTAAILSPEFFELKPKWAIIDSKGFRKCLQVAGVLVFAAGYYVVYSDIWRIYREEINSSEFGLSQTVVAAAVSAVFRYISQLGGEPN